MPQLTTQAVVAAILARETDLPLERIVDVVKRVHASASIVRDFSGDGPMPGRAAARAQVMLSGTGWRFDASNREAPAIVKDSICIVLH